MKKKGLLLAVTMVLTTVICSAQSIHIIPHHSPFIPTATQSIQTENLMQQRDGDLVSNARVYEYFPSTAPIGNIIHKIARDGTAIIDTLFEADSINYAPFYLFALNPLGEGNIRVGIEHDETGNTILRISHFSDDDLNVDPSSDIVAPLCEGLAYDRPYSCFLDDHKLIVRYYTYRPDGGFDWHFARFRLDGTLEYENTPPVQIKDGFGVFNEKPRQYYQWHYSLDDVLECDVLDKDFQPIDSFSIPEDSLDFLHDYHYIFSTPTFCPYLVVDGDDLVLQTAFEFRQDTIINYYIDTTLVWTNDSCFYGLVLSRYDKHTRQLIKWKRFDHDPALHGIECLGFQKADNGCFYLAYEEGSVSQGRAYIKALKVDANFNTIWTRYYDLMNHPEIKLVQFLRHSIPLHDNGVTNGMAIFGISTDTETNTGGLFYLFINDEGSPYGMAETLLRPYAFYPNPVQDRLRLQYSPDVQPKAITLYDLQGCLVRTQNSGLESLSMAGLAAGQYVMKVALADGKMYTDKVVKE